MRFTSRVTVPATTEFGPGQTQDGGPPTELKGSIHGRGSEHPRRRDESRDTETPLNEAFASDERCGGSAILASAVDLARDIRRRRAEILDLAERRGASNVRLFGSTARGDARPDRDV